MRTCAQAELAGLAGALAGAHEARDRAIVELTRLDEVAPRFQPGFNRGQARAGYQGFLCFLP
jgi:hypothetical protein